MPKTKKIPLSAVMSMKTQGDKKTTVKKSASEKNRILPVTNHSKQGIILNLLKRSQGATVAEMAEATGWQNHSVLGMISGVLKKKLGLTIASFKEQRGRVYKAA